MFVGGFRIPVLTCVHHLLNCGSSFNLNPVALHSELSPSFIFLNVAVSFYFYSCFLSPFFYSHCHQILPPWNKSHVSAWMISQQRFLSSTPLCYNENVVLTSSNWFGAELLLFCTAGPWRSQEQRGYPPPPHTHTGTLVKEINTELLNIIFHFVYSCDRWWMATNKTTSICFSLLFFFLCSMKLWSRCSSVTQHVWCCRNKRALSDQQRRRHTLVHPQ